MTPPDPPGPVPDDPIPLSDHARRLAAIAISRLPAGLQVRLSGEPAVVVDGQTLDPHVQVARAIRRRENPPGLCEPTPAEGRARFRRETRGLRGRPTPVGAVRDLEIPGPGGPLRVRHYSPDGPGNWSPRPLTVYLHGGGFVIGDLDTHDEPCRILCRDGEMHVASVDYRLAPEHPFPAALDDAAAALAWARGHAAELGADPARVAVGGDSAGGNLAAVVSHLVRGSGDAPAAQLLVYPATDSTRRRPSADLFGEGYFLSHADRAGFDRHYLEGTGATTADWRVSPLLAGDFAGLPPALVVSAGFDMLRDEGEEYAAALQRAGTPARLVRFPGLVHGFIHMTGVTPAARDAWRRVAREWRALLDAAG